MSIRSDSPPSSFSLPVRNTLKQKKTCERKRYFYGSDEMLESIRKRRLYAVPLKFHCFLKGARDLLGPVRLHGRWGTPGR